MGEIRRDGLEFHLGYIAKIEKEVRMYLCYLIGIVAANETTLSYVISESSFKWFIPFKWLVPAVVLILFLILFQSYRQHLAIKQVISLLERIEKKLSKSGED